MSVEKMSIAIGVFVFLSFVLGAVFVYLPQDLKLDNLLFTASAGFGLWVPGLAAWFILRWTQRRNWKIIATTVLFVLGMALGGAIAERAGHPGLYWLIGLIGGVTYAGATLTFFAAYARLREKGRPTAKP